MRKKVQNEQIKAQWDKEAPVGATSVGNGQKEKPAHIMYPELPRCRQSRRVDRSVITNLPTLRDSSASMRSRLLIRKVRLCSYVFEFNDQPDYPQVDNRFSFSCMYFWIACHYCLAQILCYVSLMPSTMDFRMPEIRKPSVQLCWSLSTTSLSSSLLSQRKNSRYCGAFVREEILQHEPQSPILLT